MDDTNTISDLQLSTRDGVDVARYIKHLADVSGDPATDGFTQCHCKHQLYVLKCFIEDLYQDLPEFPHQENEWEQERLIQLLKRK